MPAAAAVGRQLAPHGAQSVPQCTAARAYTTACDAYDWLHKARPEYAAETCVSVHDFICVPYTTGSPSCTRCCGITTAWTS